jgi:hypothetical protein
MRRPKIKIFDKVKILDSRLQRSESNEVATGLSWWRSVMRGLGSTRKRRAQATLQHLAQSDVEDTISEADVQGWLSMLEAESAKSKSKSKAHAPAPRRTDRN